MKFVKLNWKSILSFLVGLLVLYFLITRMDLRYSLEIIKKINIWHYLLAWVVYYFGFLVRGERWRFLLEKIKLKGSLIEFTKIYYLSFFVNSLVPAKIGDLYRGYLVKKRFNFSPSKVLATVMVERMSDIVFAVSILALYAFFLFPTIVPEGMADLIIIFYLILIVVVISFIIARKNKMFVLRLLPKWIRHRVHEFGHTIVESVGLSTLPRLLISTSLVWFIQFVVFYLIFESLGLGYYPFYLIVLITLLSAVLTAIPLTPAGLGAVEAGTAGFLILYGLDKNFAITFVFLERLITYWSILIFGTFVYLMSKKK